MDTVGELAKTRGNDRDRWGGRMNRTETHPRMNISTGIGLRRSPELAVLSPLSLCVSLIRELRLSRRSRRSSSNDRFSGDFDVRFEGDVGVGAGDFPLPRFDGERWKRAIHDADAFSRSNCDPSVEDDQRERSTRSGTESAARADPGTSIEKE